MKDRTSLDDVVDHLKPRISNIAEKIETNTLQLLMVTALQLHTDNVEIIHEVYTISESDNMHEVRLYLHDKNAFSIQQLRDFRDRLDEQTDFKNYVTVREVDHELE